MINLINFQNIQIDFIQIAGIYVDPENQKYLNILIWENQKDSLDISAYEVVMNLKSSYSLLLDMQKRGIPCNFHISTYNEEMVLTQMVKRGISNLTQEKEVKEKIDHIEFKVNYDSIYTICAKFIKNSIEFYSDDIQDYCKLNNLVLNSKNTNLNVRLFSKVRGFVTRNIIDLFKGKELPIRAWEPHLDLPLANNWEKKDDGRFYTNLKYTQNMDDYYILYINDERVDQTLLFYKLSFDYYIMLFGKYFYLSLIKNFMSAWSSYFDTAEEEVQPSGIVSQKTRTISPSTITVVSDFTLPTIKKLKELIFQYNLQKGYDNLDGFLISINTLYGPYVRDCIRDIILYYKDNFSLNYINMKMVSEEFKEDFSIQTIRAACMKKTFLSSDILKQVYGEHNIFGMANEYLKSCIFRYVVNIKIHS